MDNSVKTRLSRGNQPMELFRLAASILVLFVHIPFTGEVSRVINCLARCAVPGFLAISGFFCYGASAGKLAKRLWGLVKLTAVAFGLELLWNCVLIELEGGSSIGFVRAVMTNWGYYGEFFLKNTNPLRDTLWYLPAAMEVMALLWIYVAIQGKRKTDYRWFYLAGGILFLGNVAMGVMDKFLGMPVPFYWYRNSLFFGLPMLAMGVFLGEHWQKIRLNNTTLLVLVLGCLGVSFWEWYGLGGRDVMVGSVSAVFFLLLWMAKNPTLTQKGWALAVIGTFGALSTAVYVTHGVAGDFSQMFLSGLGLPLPLVTLALSLTAGLLWAGVQSLLRRVRK